MLAVHNVNKQHSTWMLAKVLHQGFIYNFCLRGKLTAVLMSHLYCRAINAVHSGDLEDHDVP